MADVPATALTPDRMESLRIYVRDLGGGLVAIGGLIDGVGGYFETPLEETLPVEMRIPRYSAHSHFDHALCAGSLWQYGNGRLMWFYQFGTRQRSHFALLQFYERFSDCTGVISFDF